jgi:NDP-mannose synthase
MSRRAVVLAGGRGTRLRPYTVVLPKPLMPLGDYPILEVIVRQLVRDRFDHITLAVNHQADIIKAYFGQGEKWGACIDYSVETEPLSTIAPLLLIPDLPDDFLLMNGDILTDLSFCTLYESHCSEKHLLSVAATYRWHKIDYGILHAGADNRLTGFIEKPETKYTVAMGVSVLNRGVLESVPEGRKFGMDDLLLELLRRGAPVRIAVHEGYWLDIGRPDDYMQAIDEFEQRRDLFLT